MPFIKKGRKPRRFEYVPRYYKPEEDKEALRRERVSNRMRVKTKARRRNPLSLLYLLALLAFAVFIYLEIG